MSRDTTSRSTARDTTATAAAARTPDTTRARSARTERGELYAAIDGLTRAKNEIEHAKHDYAGHRAEALKAIDSALHQVHLATGETGGMSAGNMPAGTNARESVELKAAIASIERARTDMEKAKHNFNGRRTQTLAAIDKALKELKLAAQNEK